MASVLLKNCMKWDEHKDNDIVHRNSKFLSKGIPNLMTSHRDSLGNPDWGGFSNFIVFPTQLRIKPIFSVFLTLKGLIMCKCLEKYNKQ